MRFILSLRLIFTACVFVAAFARAQDAAPSAQRVKQLYDSYCYVCHGTGWQGAPMTGNAADWQPRIDKGWDVVLKNAQVGLNGMPAKGTCEECRALEFKAVIEMMVKEQ